MASMQGEMGTLSDLDSLRDHAQEKRTLLDEESKILLKLKGPAQLALLEAQMKHDNLQVQACFLTCYHNNISILIIYTLISINYHGCLCLLFTVIHFSYYIIRH
jgi:hypothetical protein